jgi:hypothetical protein
MSKQTAIRWLGYELNTKLFYDISPELWEQVNEIFNKALDMEQEQIVEAFKIGSDKGYDCALDYITHEECDEQNYYNETYGGQDDN